MILVRGIWFHNGCSGQPHWSYAKCWAAASGMWERSKFLPLRSLRAKGRGKYSLRMVLSPSHLLRSSKSLSTMLRRNAFLSNRFCFWNSLAYMVSFVFDRIPWLFCGILSSSLVRFSFSIGASRSSLPFEAFPFSCPTW